MEFTRQSVTLLEVVKNVVLLVLDDCQAGLWQIAPMSMEVNGRDVNGCEEDHLLILPQSLNSA